MALDFVFLSFFFVSSLAREGSFGTPTPNPPESSSRDPHTSLGHPQPDPSPRGHPPAEIGDPTGEGLCTVHRAQQPLYTQDPDPPGWPPDFGSL